MSTRKLPSHDRYLQRHRKLEADLWAAADNSVPTQADFQRLFYAGAGRDLPAPCGQSLRAATLQIEADQTALPDAQAPTSLPADYLRRRALWLPEAARYDWIMQHTSDLPRLVTEAMTAIEAEFKPLDGVLPKDYGIFESTVLEDLMRLFNSALIKQASGDVFGRIYEYFSPSSPSRKHTITVNSSRPRRWSRPLSTSSSPIMAPSSIPPVVRAACSCNPAILLSTRAAIQPGGWSFMARRKTAIPSASPR
jgi:hypothetical protein